MKSVRILKGIVSGVALAALGIVSYMVLADVIICSSTSTTACNGTNGNDLIIVNSTNVNTVNAMGGNDRVTVASNLTQAITINGGDGNDSIFDSGGASILNGEAGNDILYGNGGNDTINGRDGNDRIFGGDGNDTINGGPGNDIIDPGPGQDGNAAPTTFIDPANTTHGGGGNNVFILRRGESGGTEYILCTTTSADRGLVKLVGYSRDDPQLPLQQLNKPLTDPNSTPTNFTQIPDGTNNFRIYHGPGRCKIILSSR